MTKQRRANGNDIPADYHAKTDCYKRKQRQDKSGLVSVFHRLSIDQKTLKGGASDRMNTGRPLGMEMDASDVPLLTNDRH